MLCFITLSDSLINKIGRLPTLPAIGLPAIGSGLSQRRGRPLKFRGAAPSLVPSGGRRVDGEDASPGSSGGTVVIRAILRFYPKIHVQKCILPLFQTITFLVVYNRYIPKYNG